MYHLIYQQDVQVEEERRKELSTYLKPEFIAIYAYEKTPTSLTLKIFASGPHLISQKLNDRYLEKTPFTIALLLFRFPLLFF